MSCKFTKADGTPCRAPLVEGRDWCIFHDPSPDSARTRKAGRKKGGMNRKTILKLVTLPPESPELPVKTGEDVLALIGKTLNLILVGKLSVGIGHVVASLCSVALKSMDTERVQRDLMEWRAEQKANRGGRRCV